METETVLTTVLLVWLIAVVIPGPNFFITAQTAASGSRRSAFFVVLGITSGTGVWAVSGSFGITLLFHAVPLLYVVAKILGGAYLVYLGLRLIAPKPAGSIETGGFPAPPAGPYHCFRRGLLTNLSNPKTAAFVTSLFAAALPADTPYGTGLLSMAVMCSVSFSWYSLVACLFSLGICNRVYRKFRRGIECTAGGIFIAFGACLAADR